MLIFKNIGSQFKNVQKNELVLDGREVKRLKKQGVELIKVPVIQVYYYSQAEFAAFYEKHVAGITDAAEFTVLVKPNGSQPSEVECQELMKKVFAGKWIRKMSKMGSFYFEIPLPITYFVKEVANGQRSQVMPGLFRFDPPKAMEYDALPAQERNDFDAKKAELEGVEFFPIIYHIEHTTVAKS